MTREEYKTKKLGAVIGDLYAQITELEFTVQYLNEEVTRLKEENKNPQEVEP